MNSTPDPRAPLQEKELRIALVCFGGVSLAVYIHGVTAEILKLVRASAALHSISDRDRSESLGYADISDRNATGFDTEAVYFQLLRDIGRTVDLRVIVDVIAGASAGGINATMLARALSHDLPMSSLRDLWLDNGDVAELLAPEARAGRWSKWFLRPLLWLAHALGLAKFRDLEIRRKLSLFLRSRWFQPPLDGSRMLALMYDAVTAMGEPRHPAASLLPSHQALDLYVTLTDYHGYQKLVQIHDPPAIYEREHRHVLHFRCRRDGGLLPDSDFTLANAPELAFAARATSSFPGAFPPAQIGEMDVFLRQRAVSWPRRGEFIRRNFEPYQQANIDPVTVPFIDGSVVNNRPFREALAAIRGRAAYRDVDRRVVYIDPDPALPGAPTHHDLPGFFATLRGASSDIPRAQPVADELGWVNEFNEQARHLKEVVRVARPQIDRYVANLMAASDQSRLSVEQIGRWREQATEQARSEAGFAYDSYVQLNLASCRALLSRQIMAIRGVHPKSPFARGISAVIDAWAERAGLMYQPAGASAAHGVEVRWLQVLRAFNIDYYKRRLSFLIRGQNRLQQLAEAPGSQPITAAAVQSLKGEFYARLEVLQHREPGSAAPDAAILALIAEIFAVGPAADQTGDMAVYAQQRIVQCASQLDQLVERLTAQLDLEGTTRELDQLLVTSLDGSWPPEARREVLVNYLGFPFWDILTFPLMRWPEMGEFDEVLVDRISARDAKLLNQLACAQSVRGVEYAHFAAFLSRSYRENDYLLGRLHGLDRLVDIVCNSAGAEAIRNLDIVGLKLRGFNAILDAEESHLPNIAGTIAELRRCFASGRESVGGRT